MKKLFAMLLVLLSACFVLAACGGGDELPDGVTYEEVEKQDIIDLFASGAMGDGASAEDLYAELPDTFEDLLGMLELDTQKNEYLAELEQFVTALEGEISGMKIKVNGETVSLGNFAGMDILYAGVKDGAVLLTTEVPILDPYTGEATTMETNMYMTVDLETKTVHAVTEASGIIVDHQTFTYDSLMDAYLSPESEQLLELGMMYDTYVAELKAATEDTTLPALLPSEIIDHGDNKFTISQDYFLRVMKEIYRDEVDAQTFDTLIDMIDLEIDYTVEMYNKTTLKSASASVSADLAEYLYGIDAGNRKANFAMAVSLNYEGDMQLTMSFDVTDMMKIDVAVSNDVTRKDGEIVKGTESMTLSLTSDKKILFGAPDEDDFVLENNVATVSGKTAISLVMSQSFDLTACDRENATVYSMTYELDADVADMKTSGTQELTIKTGKVGTYVLTEQIRAEQGDQTQEIDFTLDFAIGTAEKFDVPQVILDALNR